MTRTEDVVTPFGTVPVKIVDCGFEPLALVIRGAFPAREDWEWLEPEAADAAFLHLPGFHSPTLAEISVAMWIEAFDNLIEQRFRGRPITVLGVSTGAIVAAGLKSPEIRSRVLVEPFISTEDLWPLREWFVRTVPADATAAWKWIWETFGFSRDLLEHRNYEANFRAGVPVIGVVGDRPLLPPRPLDGFPSFTGEKDRARLLALGVELRLFQGGHNVNRDAPEAVPAALRAALDRQVSLPA